MFLTQIATPRVKKQTRISKREGVGDIRDAQFLKGTGLILAAAKSFAVWVMDVKF